jgi:putative ABC transport system permease protein
LGTLNRAVRNISRRKTRALLVIIALGFSLAILISIPAGVLANQQAASKITNNLGSTITQTEQELNQTLNQITCSLASGFGGFGFTGGSGTTTGHTGGFGGPGSGGYGGFGGFGGGSTSGQFGAGAFGGGQMNPMNETLYSDINSSISGIAAVEPALQVSEGTNQTVSFNGHSFTRMVPQYIIEGVPLTSNLVGNYPILPTDIVSGTNLQAGETGDVLLSENNSAYFGVSVGGTVNILGTNFNVVGIYSPTGVEDTEMLYMNLSDAQALTNNTGYITSVVVFTDSPSDVSSVSTAISALHSELQVSTNQAELSSLESNQSGTNTALTDAQNSLATTNSTAIEEIIVVVVATSLIVLFVMLYTVRERTKEIGTLKAIGFSNSAVMSQFMLEGVMLSAIAGVVGIAIGVLAAPSLASLLLPTVGRVTGFGGPALGTGVASTVAVSPELLIIGFGAAILLGTLGSLYPAWRAAKIKPAEAMKYE